jgi:hypothetical protein
MLGIIILGFFNSQIMEEVGVKKKFWKKRKVIIS